MKLSFEKCRQTFNLGSDNHTEVNNGEAKTNEVHKLTDTETMLAVLQSENARLKDCAKTNADRQAQNTEIQRKNYEGWRRENLKLQNELLASQERVFELQDKLLALREIVNGVTVAGSPKE